MASLFPLIGQNAGLWGRRENIAGLVKRRLDDVTLEPVRGGAAGGTWPFYSPKGNSIGFFAGGKLKKVISAGGAAIDICDVPANARGAWGDDGTIVVARALCSECRRAVARSRKCSMPATSTSLSRSSCLGRRPVLVPEWVPPAIGRIEVIDLQTRARHTITEGAAPKLASTGELLFSRQGRIWGMKFDVKLIPRGRRPENRRRLGSDDPRWRSRVCHIN